MTMLSRYEQRLLREAEARAKAQSPSPPPVPITVVRVDPQYANRVSKIRFGRDAVRDFPRIASLWASDYAEHTEGND
jgi:Iap family predicted aminopeptidase